MSEIICNAFADAAASLISVWSRELHLVCFAIYLDFRIFIYLSCESNECRTCLRLFIGTLFVVCVVHSFTQHFFGAFSSSMPPIQTRMPHDAALVGFQAFEVTLFA